MDGRALGRISQTKTHCHSSQTPMGWRDEVKTENITDTHNNTTQSSVIIAYGAARPRLRGAEHLSLVAEAANPAPPKKKSLKTDQGPEQSGEEGLNTQTGRCESLGSHLHNEVLYLNV